MTGDVFAEVEIPGVDDGGGLAMVLAHPCSMREGAHLRSHLQLARVIEGEPIPLSAWDGHYGVMPLPLLQVTDERMQRGVFELAGRVPSAVLSAKSRIACLERQGILLLMQRLAFSSTRVVIDLPTLHESIAHVLEEADLLEDWTRARLETVPDGDDPLLTIWAEEEAFEGVISAEVDGRTYRDRLRDPAERPGVRRTVREALRR